MLLGGGAGARADPISTPVSIKNNPFLKLILLEQTPLLTCFGFVASQKWLVSRRINLRKALFSIDVGVKISVQKAGSTQLVRPKSPDKT